MMTFAQFRVLLAENGYQYGQDAAENAFLGYELGLRAAAKKCDSIVEQSNNSLFRSGAKICAAQLRESAAPAQSGEPVGEIVLFGGDCKEVSWLKGKMPPAGTLLYTAPAPNKELIAEWAQYYHGARSLGLKPYTFDEYVAKVETGEFGV